MTETEGLQGPEEQRAGSGIVGLDDVINGGFPRQHLYLVEGQPGSGKTTLALQFLLEGVRLGEPVLYITLSETSQELRYVAQSHGWKLDGVELVELGWFEERNSPEAQYTIFAPSEVELGDTMSEIRAAVERVRPTRVVFDSLSEMRLLERDPLRFRREVLGLKQFFAQRGATVLLLDDRTGDHLDLQLQSLVHGVISLERLATEFGAERRRMIVKKLRASRFRGGYHDYRIQTGGLQVYPRLVASEHRATIPHGSLLSGVGNLDDLLGGGLDRGTSTVILGPAGCGKSTIAAMYGLAAATKEERVAIFLFDENLGTLIARCEGLGMPMAENIASGNVTVQQIDPAEMSPGEFTQAVRDAVEKRGVRLVVLDSLNGLINAMPEEKLVLTQLHELLSYLNQVGVTTVITIPQHGLVGTMVSQADISYLADSVLLLRYFEAAGAVRQAISVLKRRTGPHERTIREFQIGPGGVLVGAPLHSFHGVLTGVPRYVGTDEPLMPGMGDGDPV
jgi:circadian clock protein KaiC